MEKHNSAPLYDPTEYNDRLLLGLRGMMSEAELRILRRRMYQAALNKARRGELVTYLPLGYIRTPHSEVAKDPDLQIQSVFELVFAKFDQLGSAMSLLRYLREQGVRLPIRPIHGPSKGVIEWRKPVYSALDNMLHNPTYAGGMTGTGGMGLSASDYFLSFESVIRRYSPGVSPISCLNTALRCSL